jgi:DNA-binding NtrC family response regulator
VQVKLLRPLQNREYVPVGDSKPHKIQGRLIFATHRDLKRLCKQGRFREDLYERLNGVRVHMPPLRKVLAEAPEELGAYVQGFVEDAIGDGEEAEALARRVVREIQATGARYAWPRNLRELKNYVGRYVATGGRVEALEQEEEEEGSAPGVARKAVEATEEAPPSSGLFGRRAKAGEVSVPELTRAYVTRVYVLTGLNQSETARRTGLTRRTVMKTIDWELFDRLMKGKAPAGR